MNNTPGEKFEYLVTVAYNDTIFRRKNLFLIPSKKTGKRFIKELTFWLDQYDRDTKLHKTALKLFILVSNLVMQTPSKESNAKEQN